MKQFYISTEKFRLKLSQYELLGVYTLTQKLPARFPCKI